MRRDGSEMQSDKMRFGCCVRSGKALCLVLSLSLSLVPLRSLLTKSSLSQNPIRLDVIGIAFVINTIISD